MKNAILSIIVISISIGCCGQSTEQLDNLFGFKEFKLLSSINGYKKDYVILRTYKGTDGLIKYVIKGSNYNISLNEINVKEIEFLTINDTIFQCNVTLPSCGYKTIESAFGEPDLKPNWRSETICNFPVTYTYSWIGKKVKLVLEEHEPSTKILADGTLVYSGESDDILSFMLIDDQIMESMLSNGTNNVLSDFGSTAKTDLKIEPCFYNTYEINMLNQKWWTGNGICLRKEDYPSSTSSFDLNIGKNKDRSIVYITYYTKSEYRSGFAKTDLNFTGNLEIFLSNGERISCIDRGLTGVQMNDENTNLIFAIYYLTTNEYKQLSTTNIESVKIRFGPYGQYENYVFNNIKQSFGCTIEGIDEVLK